MAQPGPHHTAASVRSVHACTHARTHTRPRRLRAREKTVNAAGRPWARGSPGVGPGGHLTLSLLLVSGRFQQLLQQLPHHVLAGGGTQGGPHALVQEVLRQRQGECCADTGRGGPALRPTWEGLLGTHGTGHGTSKSVPATSRLEAAHGPSLPGSARAPRATRQAQAANDTESKCRNLDLRTIAP